MADNNDNGTSGSFGNIISGLMQADHTIHNKAGELAGQAVDALLGAVGAGNRKIISYAADVIKVAGMETLEQGAIANSPGSSESAKEGAKEAIERKVIGAMLVVLSNTGNPSDLAQSNRVHEILAKGNLNADFDGVMREGLNGPRNPHIEEILKNSGIEVDSLIPADVANSIAALKTPKPQANQSAKPQKGH